MTLKEALSKLDPNNQDHWTTDGSPRIDVLKSLMGEEGAGLDRGTVLKEFPDFRKTNLTLPDESQTNAETETLDNVVNTDPPILAALSKEELLKRKAELVLEKSRIESELLSTISQLDAIEIEEASKVAVINPTLEYLRIQEAKSRSKTKV